MPSFLFSSILLPVSRSAEFFADSLLCIFFFLQMIYHISLQSVLLNMPVRNIPSIPTQCVVPSEYIHTVSFQVPPGFLHSALHLLSKTPASDQMLHYFPMKKVFFLSVFLSKTVKALFRFYLHLQYISARFPGY